MSRTVKKQLFSIIDLLEKANRVLEKGLRKTQADIQGIRKLLIDCQNSAIDIGSKIEALYGEGTGSVKGLEIYCEELYRMTLALENDDIELQRDVMGHLKKQIKCIRKMISVDISDNLEIVFLPYKTSMWDSLESIWMAAKADEHCNAYVIPIPYFDKNPDGSFGEEHYEGNEYPSYVPVTKYEEYDFGLHQPDIIYIHNAYDNGNYVTSVHPFFYSENLKKFTEKLIYIPYYILEGKGIDEAYVLNTGVLNADYVVVQNEKEKEDYISHFKKAFPHLDISKKILPLGSPKFDKVRLLKEKNVNVSAEWYKRCEGKKVIFYNTSITGLLKGNEQYIKKMEDVFRFFEERKDTLLWWRPHPLLESSLSSMRPALYEQYMELKRKFIEMNIGIFDDTPDMYTAIAMSDAYYGDWSSVVWLYQQTGKHVMIQDNYVFSYEEKDNLRAFDFVLDGNFVWFIPYKYCLLCCYDLNEKKFRLIRQLPEEGMYINLLKIDNMILLIPYTAKQIYSYDIKQDMFHCICTLEDMFLESKFFKSFFWKEKLFLFPLYYPAIVEINTYTWEVKYLRTWYKDQVLKSGEQIFQWDSCVKDNIVYIPFVQSNGVFCFDMEQEKYKVIEIGDCNTRYMTVACGENDMLFLTDQNSDVVIYNETDGQIELVKNVITECGFSEQKIAFKYSMEFGNEILFFPGQADKIGVLNTNNHIMHVMEFQDDLPECQDYDSKWKGTLFSVFHEKKQYIYGMNMRESCFYQIDMKSKKRTSCCFVLTEEELKIHGIHMQCENKDICCEGKELCLRLERFMDSLEVLQKGSQEEEKQGVGERIYKIFREC